MSISGTSANDNNKYPNRVSEYVVNNGYGTCEKMTTSNVSKLQAGDAISVACSCAAGSGHLYYGQHMIFVTKVANGKIYYAAKNNQHLSSETPITATYAGLTSYAKNWYCSSCGSYGSIWFTFTNKKSNSVPSAPTISSVTGISTSQVKIAWGAVTGAEKYRVDYKASTDSSWTTLTSTLTSTSYIARPGFKVDVTYDFRVYAINSAGTSAASATKSGKPLTKKTYTACKAITWATNKTNFNNFSGKSAQFTRMALYQGDMPIPEDRGTYANRLLQWINDNGYGYYKGTTDSNCSLLTAGSVIIFVCKNHSDTYLDTCAYGVGAMYVTAVDKANNKFTFCAKQLGGKDYYQQTCSLSASAIGAYAPQCTTCSSNANVIAYLVITYPAHSLTKTAAKSATCTEAGNTEYYTCSGCSKYFSDSAGTKEITKNSWALAATGHSYDEGVVTQEATTSSTGIKTYTCTKCGATKTETIEKLEEELAIVTQPKNKSVAVGKNATFTVEATGTDLTYQWQYSKNGTTWKNSTLTGNTTSKLTVPATTARNGQKYRCIVTDSNGSTVTSNAAKLTVTTTTITITTQPANKTVTEGSNAIFKVVAEGTGLTYQWQYSKDGTTWYKSGLTGNKTASLTVPATKARNGQQYRCVITDENGNSVVSEAVKLTVKSTAITITTQPSDASVITGTNATFKVVAEGTDLTYQWQYSKDGTTWNKSGLTGNNTSKLTVPATNARNGQQYRCVITDSNGNTEVTNVVKLTLK